MESSHILSNNKKQKLTKINCKQIFQGNSYSIVNAIEIARELASKISSLVGVLVKQGLGMVEL